VTITVCGSRGGCCPGAIFSGGAFQVGDCEFNEGFSIVGHRDPAFQRDWMDGQGARVSLNHPWHGSAMVPAKLATALAAFNPGAITMG
jgi:hypothetical protein